MNTKTYIRNILAAIAVSAFAVGSAQANLLVSSGSWSRLYSPTGTMLMSYTETDANYQGNAFDSAGNVYFADFGFGIRKYNGATGAFISNVTDNTFFGAAWPLYGLSSKGTATPAGDLIASYTLGANAHFAFLDTSLTNSATLSPAYGPTYEGINWSQAAGVMYATTPNAGGLMQVFDGAGTFLGINVAVGTAPKGVVRDDSNGMHYVADFGGSVWRWDGVNPASTFITGLGADSAYGVTAVGNGDIWVSNYTSGDLSRYNSLGALQSSFNVGANPSFITYTAVPEPSTIGLFMISGLAVLTLIRRRCRA